MNRKMQWLRNQMLSLNLQGMIVTNPVNIKYLTNIQAEGILLVTRKENLFITDGRYIEDVHNTLTLFDEIVVYDVRGLTKEDFENIWIPYFDLERDYGTLCRKFMADRYLAEAVDTCYGIRLLRQEPWEAICSFIISQNNNIPRIKGIIDRLCRLLGEPLGNDDYSFPSAQKIAEAGVEALAPIRAGFRAKYIIDAAEKVANGEIDIEDVIIMGLKTPGIRINRAEFLKSELFKRYPQNIIDDAIANNPALYEQLQTNHCHYNRSKYHILASH